LRQYKLCDIVDRQQRSLGIDHLVSNNGRDDQRVAIAIDHSGFVHFGRYYLGGDLGHGSATWPSNSE
jgi:hypothetical protein